MGMRKLTVIAALVAVVTVMATGAHAVSSKGGGKGKNSGAATTPGIWLNQDATTLHLGSKVTFTTSYSGLSGNEYAQIGLSCSQSGHVVYGELQGPDYTFTLGGGSSEWWDVGGGASCTATLYAYSLSGGSESIRWLAATDFTVS
jgi:hypothetical protein